MGCACSDQKHRKESKGHEHSNSSNSNKFHVSIADFSVFNDQLNSTEKIVFILFDFVSLLLSFTVTYKTIFSLAVLYFLNITTVYITANLYISITC